MIAALPANLHRDRGHQMAKLANAVIATKQPEPDRAARLGLACLDLTRYTGSARIGKELHTLDVAFRARWPISPIPGPSTTPLPPAEPIPKLDRKIADKRVFPAIDINSSPPASLAGLRHIDLSAYDDLKPIHASSRA